MHFLLLVNCGMPNCPENGSIQPHLSTLGGSVVEFGCAPGFIPTERKNATCTLNGSWSPDPRILVCNCEITGCCADTQICLLNLTDAHLVHEPWFVYISGISRVGKLAGPQGDPGVCPSTGI